MGDIYPTAYELILLHTKDPEARWWLLDREGNPVGQEEQHLLRPADANPANGNYHTPWYQGRSHLHDEDHDLPWSIHAFGTLEGVRALHATMLKTLGTACTPP